MCLSVCLCVCVEFVRVCVRALYVFLLSIVCVRALALCVFVSARSWVSNCKCVYLCERVFICMWM